MYFPNFTFGSSNIPPPRSSSRGERWQEKKSERLRSPRGDGRSRSPPVFPGCQASCHLTTHQVTGYRFDAVAIRVWALPSRWCLAAGVGPLGSISSAWRSPGALPGLSRPARLRRVVRTFLTRRSPPAGPRDDAHPFGGLRLR